MERIVFATGNKGKLAEIREILKDYEVISMAEAGIDVDIVEDGSSFEENAMKKAEAVWKECGSLVMADDSGLVVDALGGEPGIYSARYLGEDVPFSEKMDDILRRMEDVREEDRSARFVCAMAAILPDGTRLTTLGTMEGRIAHEKLGDKGFGYDPIVYMEKYGLTVAQMDAGAKNAESHRGMALRLMRDELRRRLS